MRPDRRKERPQAFANLRRNAMGLRILAGYLAIVASAFMIAWVLSGCTTTNYTGTGTCANCIGPYDVTLSSHRRALGLGY